MLGTQIVFAGVALALACLAKPTNIDKQKNHETTVTLAAVNNIKYTNLPWQQWTILGTQIYRDFDSSQ